MKSSLLWVVTVCGLTVLFARHSAGGEQANARTALQPFNDLVGSWKATGTPEGTLQEKRRGFWVERATWEWQLKGDDAWLKVAFDKGKHWSAGELRFLPDKDLFQLKATTTAGNILSFTGPFQDRRLTLERVDNQSGEIQRLIVTLVSESRFLYAYETRRRDSELFVRHYQVGATKEGAFATVGSEVRECIVTGGRGTTTVTYQGRTYYVCCSGCRDAFKDDPEKFIREYEAKLKQRN